MARPSVPPRRLAEAALGGAAALLDGAAGRLSDQARVARFLRGRLAFAARPDDVYVVTYPRSGTTWMQLILHLLKSGGSMDFAHLAEVSPWWERSLARGMLTAADLERLPSPRVLKSHLPYAWLPRQGRCIYIERNVEDVALSYYHLYASHLGYRGSLDAFVDRFVRGELQYGSWRRHVAGWRRQRRNRRVLFLHYEEMHADTAASVRRVAAFCGLPAPEGLVARVVEQASFASMKAHEDRFDHIGELLAERGIGRGAFVREGRVGGGRAQLSQAQLDRLTRLGSRPVLRPDLEWRLADFLH